MQLMNNLLYNTITNFFDKNENYEEITILSNTSAIIYQLFPNINWVGFYLYKDDILQLGPFQGKPACMKIPLDKGVCGYSARNKSSIIVPDVHKFEGHIACDSDSNSELVVPIVINNKLYGLLDIDSTILNRFSDDDLILFTNIVDYIISIIKK
jgi:GAF domain-containing protein